MIRLNKYIADCGIASRRKAEEFIKEGRVTVNDKVVIDLSFKVDLEMDKVELDGELLKPSINVYFLLNKPKGIISSTIDEKKRITVIDLIKTKEKIYPVGRLDFNTTGVLLLTNDGEFKNFLTHPKNNIARIYEVRLEKPLTDEDRNKLLKGIYIDNKRGKFSIINFPKPRDRKNVEVTAMEGRNHFVKDMFRALGYNVIQLNRKSFGGLIADIPLGEYRKLTKSEVEYFKKKNVK